jgi:hypothetical protein
MGNNESGRERSVTITVDEDADRTLAFAEMDWHDRKLVGVGRTRSGEELPTGAAERLCVSRALSDLVARLDASAPGGNR